MRKILTFALFVQCVSPAFSGPASNLESSSKAVESTGLDPIWTAQTLGGGVKSNGEFTDANFFFLYPWNNTIGEDGNMDGSMFFMEAYGLWAERGELGASLGLGFRRLFSNQSISEASTDDNPGLLGEGVYVGANAFIDYGNSSNSQDHWQAGFGLELGSRYVEIRGNYYLPTTDDRVIRTNRFFEVYEEALEGWDVELALLVPVIDRYMDVQLIGGYSSYSGDRSRASDFEGWRAGVEARPVPNLVLGATWFENEQLYEDNWLASISFEISLDKLGNMISGTSKPRRRHLAERMSKIVRRKNSALTYANNCDPPTVNCQITD